MGLFAVLEQVSPDAVFTSSKADDRFIAVCQKYGTLRFPSSKYTLCIVSLGFIADASSGAFQIRPHKDFTPSKGRNHLLSLSFLSSLEDQDEQDESDLGSASEPRSAYEFMRKRKDKYGDPTMRRWNAGIRMSNFAAVDTAPLCVSSHFPLFVLSIRTNSDGPYVCR